ncbi:hypothetical protein F5I97DRAFT_153857 [Phlebopus sp. FC_14]|nr:hypothetical protein F5I97DRAFT_153857 [Phlebopus sp. FC_14]
MLLWKYLRQYVAKMVADSVTYPQGRPISTYLNLQTSFKTMASDVEASVCGCCALFITSSLEAWCNLHAFGADIKCCGGQRGCCGRCCDSSFDKDDFDERIKKHQERQRENHDIPVAAQPLPTPKMIVPDNTAPADTSQVSN